MAITSNANLGLLVMGHQQAAELARLVELADESGYDTLWHADERFFRDCWVSLGLAAAHSRRLRLGVCVTDPYIRHPAVTATAVATLDDASAGRAVLGLGAGISGFAELGIVRDRPLRALRECVELVRALLADGRADYDGEVISFRDGAMGVPGRADLPIVIASNGPRTMELAGEVADGLIVQGLASAEMVTAARERLAAGMEQRRDGRDRVQLIARVDVGVAEDGQAARDAMRPGLVRHLRTHHPHYRSQQMAGLEVPDWLRERVGAIAYGHGAEGAAALEALVPDEFIDRLCLAGTADEVAGHMAELMRAGVDEILAFPVTLPGQRLEDVVRAIATDVRSRARGLAGPTAEASGAGR